MRFDILTIFPDIIYQYASESILKRAQKAGLVEIYAHNFRDFTTDKQRHVDDHPYGGGPGMVLQIQPIYDTLKSLGLVKNGKKIKIKKCKLKIVALDPAGKKFDQRMAEKFSKLDRLVLICGRYEGFDERVYKLADERISAGDYILSGGELPALTIVEAVSRLVPGVLGNEESLVNETFSIKTPRHKNTAIQKNCNTKIPGRMSVEAPDCLSTVVKKYPVYTRPENFMGSKVPKVLLSGNHKKIEEWRKNAINKRKKGLGKLSTPIHKAD